jgi:hypothetical protein
VALAGYFKKKMIWERGWAGQSWGEWDLGEHVGEGQKAAPLGFWIWEKKMV